MKIEIGTSVIKYRNLTVDHVFPASILFGSSAVYPLSSNKGICRLSKKNLKKYRIDFFYL